jgi:signal transduction histidine kinase
MPQLERFDVRALTGWVRDHVPHGGALQPEDFQRRHRQIMIVLAGLTPTLALQGLLLGWGAVDVLAPIVILVALPALIATRVSARRLSASIASIGLLAAAVLMVHFSHGSTEAHFLFFVLLPLIALYQDWVPFVVSVAVVVGHHTILGYLFPGDVFEHEGAQRSPLIWALIHGAFIVALIVILLMHWKAAEASRLELNRAIFVLENTQSQLVHAQKLESIGGLAAGVAHEINTPIQYIGDNLRFLDSAFVDLLAMLDDSPASATADDRIIEDSERAYLMTEVPEALVQSLTGIERVTEIVRALKGVAHPNPDPSPGLDLNQLIRDTMTVTRNEWKTIATLRLDLDADLPTVCGAAGPLSQVLVNGIVNASHAIVDRYGPSSHDAGLIEITTRRSGEVVEIDLRDNGCGMSTAVANRAFDPFFTTKAVGRGTGQGLSISHAVIVDQHCGSIRIDSEPGQGTTIHVALPISGPLTGPLTVAASNQMTSL